MIPQQNMVETSNRTQRVVVGLALGLALLAGLLYWPTLDAEFVYDDRPQILVDDFLHQSANWVDVLTLRVLRRDVIDRNRPVQLLSLMIDAALWGKDPWGYHLTNLLLHAACVGLVTMLLHRLLTEPGVNGPVCRGGTALTAAGVGGLLFAVHPVMSEAVCVISYREDLLGTLFVLLSLLAATFFQPRLRGRNVILLLGCALAGVLAVASKESGVAASAVVVIYWLCFRRREPCMPWLALMILSLGLSALMLALIFLTQPAHSEIFVRSPERLGGAWVETLTIQPRLWTFQLQTLIQPQLLSADYGPYSVRHVSLSMALTVLAALLAALGLWGWWRRRVYFALGLIAAAILPVSNLLPIYNPLADRYLYLPMVGLVMLAALALTDLDRWLLRWISMIIFLFLDITLFMLCLLCLLSRPPRKTRQISIITVCACMVVCVLLAMITHDRISVWNNSVALWEDATAKNPRSSRAANNLGFAYFDDDQADKALRAWKTAVTISQGRHAEAWAGLSLLYESVGMTSQADRAFLEAVKADRRFADATKLVSSLFWEPHHVARFQTVIARNVQGKPESRSPENP